MTRMKKVEDVGNVALSIFMYCMLMALAFGVSNMPRGNETFTACWVDLIF